MSISSTTLQNSTKVNMFPDENEGEPKLEIIEHPKSRGFRFRYTCEGPSHGGIPGASSDKNKKTFPAVKIVNYQGYARIVVQLVTNEENPRLHPHSLVGKQCQNGICTVQCGPKDMTATFPNLGIQHVTKKNVASILEERYIAAEMQLSSINDGFPQEVQRNIKDEDRKRIAAKAQSEAKSIDLSVVRLMFIAYLPDSNGAFTIMLKPVISEAIFDSKAPNAATLKICRMDCNAGSACGGDEVYLLCDKVQKDDIQVRFVEEDLEGRDIWESYGQFCPTDVHRQFAIVFRTPAYKDQGIKSQVTVNVQLRRKSDGEVSDPKQFTYLPNKTDLDYIDRKRRKVMPEFLDHLPGGNSQGFNFGNTGSSMMSGGYRFQASPNSNSGGGKPKEARLPPAAQENPQKGPMDPALLVFNLVKHEPKSPPQQFGSPNSQSYLSSSQASSSPMSVGGSSQAPSPQSDTDYFPGTQIPKPKNAKTFHIEPKPSQVGPGIETHHSSVSNTQYGIQLQELHFNQQNTTTWFDHQIKLEDLMVEDITTAVSSVSNSGVTTDFTDTSPTQGNPATQQHFNPQSFDHNHNPLQTANNPDQMVQMFSDEILKVLDGPGSGSSGLSSYYDPLMTVPIGRQPAMTLSPHCNFNNINSSDFFADIESDAFGETRLNNFARPPIGDDNVDAIDFATGYDYDDAEPTVFDQISAVKPVETGISGLPTVQSDDINSSADLLANMSLTDGYLQSAKSVPTQKSQPKQKMQRPPQKPTFIQQAKETIKLEVADSTSDSKGKVNPATIDPMSYLLEWSKRTTCAMHDYSVTGDVRMLLVLQRHFTSITDENGDTVIHVAVIHDQLEVLTSLLDVIVTLDNCLKTLNSVNNQQQTALHIAALTDNVEAVIDLLKAGADPLVTDKNGNHSIHVASRHGNADILARLLSSKQTEGRTYDVKNHKGWGCYHLAAKAKKDNRQCMKLLKTRNFDVDMCDMTSGRTALHVAVENNDLVAAGCLISECDADIEAATFGGYTALHLAAANDCCEIATLLLACGADPDVSSLPPGSEGEDAVIPLDLTQSDEMRDILSGKSYRDNESFLNESWKDVDDLIFLDPVLRMKFCKLLNNQQTGSDWIALADRLQLSMITSTLRTSDNPMDPLIHSYMACHGSVDGLRSALIHIGRHDALQVLNRALYKGTHLQEGLKKRHYTF